MRRHNLRGGWGLTGTLLESLDEPAARRAGGIGREIGSRHRQYQALLDKVFDRQLDESTFHEILLHRVQRHAAPAQSFEKKGVLGKKIAQSPRERRHDSEFAPNRQLG